MSFNIFRVLEELDHIQEQLTSLYAKSKEIDVVDTKVDFPGKSVLIEGVRACFREATKEPAKFLQSVLRCATLLANFDTFREQYADVDGETLEAIIDATNVNKDRATEQLRRTATENPEAIRRHWLACFPRGGYREVMELIDTIENRYLVPFHIDRGLEPELGVRITQILSDQ